MNDDPYQQAKRELDASEKAHRIEMENARREFTKSIQTARADLDKAEQDHSVQLHEAQKQFSDGLESARADLEAAERAARSSRSGDGAI